MSAENVPAWLSMSCSTYIPPLVTMVSPPRYMATQEQVSTSRWLALPHLRGQESTMMDTMVSIRENWVPRPRASSMTKKRRAHTLEPGRRDTASGYTMKARPGPSEAT